MKLRNNILAAGLVAVAAASSFGYATQAQAVEHYPMGWIDGISADGTLYGWAMDGDIPNNTIEVHVYFDGMAGISTMAMATRTDKSRPDVVAATGHEGNKGFELMVPQSLRDGKMHTAYAYGIDYANGSENSNPSGNRMLNGSPFTFTIGNNGMGNPSTMAPTTMTKAAGLRVAMNNLLSEHVSVSLSTLRSIFNESDDLESMKQAQDDNAVELAAAIGSIYGTEAQNQFLAMFREHIVSSNDYTVALRDNDEAAQEEAIEELEEYLDEISAFLSNAIPSLPKANLYAALREHEELLNSAMRAYQDGDYEESADLERQALKQIAGGADLLSEGIVMRFPEKF